MDSPAAPILRDSHKIKLCRIYLLCVYVKAGPYKRMTLLGYFAIPTFCSNHRQSRACMKALNLQVKSSLSPSVTAEGKSLRKLSAQLMIDAL
jgi:hypothetical protein